MMIDYVSAFIISASGISLVMPSHWKHTASRWSRHIRWDYIEPSIWWHIVRSSRARLPRLDKPCPTGCWSYTWVTTIIYASAVATFLNFMLPSFSGICKSKYASCFYIDLRFTLFLYVYFIWNFGVTFAEFHIFLLLCAYLFGYIYGCMRVYTILFHIYIACHAFICYLTGISAS